MAPDEMGVRGARARASGGGAAAGERGPRGGGGGGGGGRGARARRATGGGGRGRMDGREASEAVREEEATKAREEVIGLFLGRWTGERLSRLTADIWIGA